MDVVRHNQLEISVVAAETSPKQYIQQRLSHTAEVTSQSDEPFYVFDVGKVVDQYERWVAALPNIQPFYAVKCNNEPVLLKTLAALGAGFDCASKKEIDAVLALGVSPNRIVYANTYKNPSFLKHAQTKDVDLMTFDSENELQKVKKHYPLARLMLRLKSDGGAVLSKFGDKFGCTVTEGKELLRKAKELELHVVGICFHVGLNCQSPNAYEVALESSAELFAYASDLGFQLNLLDIGGGFTTTELFEMVATGIKTALNTYFSSYPCVKVIAEPGFYFASTTHALAVCVIGKRIRDTHTYMYYLSHGLFGSYLNYHILNYTPPLSTLKDNSLLPLHDSILWGPTCAPPDKLCEMQLPELDIGDWFVSENFGAYTHCMASAFNGFPVPPVHYYVTENKSNKLGELLSARQEGTCLSPRLVFEQ